MADADSALSHVSIGVKDLERSGAFYDRVLATIGCRRIMEHEGSIAYGRAFPEFWLQKPLDGGPAGVANGTHFAFLARSKDEVQAFWDAGMAAGGRDDGAPGLRPQYSPAYYGCFLRDPDGHKIEAMTWDESAQGEG